MYLKENLNCLQLFELCMIVGFLNLEVMCSVPSNNMSTILLYQFVTVRFK